MSWFRRKKRKSNKQSPPVNFRADDSLKSIIKKRMAELGIDKSKFIRKAILFYDEALRTGSKNIGNKGV